MLSKTAVTVWPTILVLSEFRSLKGKAREHLRLQVTAWS